MIALFARSDHPKGWGTGYVVGHCDKGHYIASDNGAAAHGYVVVAVRCDPSEVPALRERMRAFHGTGAAGGQYAAGTLGEWFGGTFDHIASLPTDAFNLCVESGPHAIIGDNRFVGVFDAAEVLA